LESSQQQGRTGHPIGVVIAADRKGFTVFAGLTDAIDRDRKIRKMAASIGQIRWRDEVCHGVLVQPATEQQGPQGQR
jgi:hypothetical protein